MKSTARVKAEAQKERRRYRARRASMIRRLAAIAERETERRRKSLYPQVSMSFIADLWISKLMERMDIEMCIAVAPKKPTIEVIPELMIVVPL